jgi:DNA-binding transcriptional LysR family regulator
LSIGIVPAVIERITRQYPRVSFHVVEGDLAILQRELRDRAIELLIGRASTQISDEDMESESLFDDRLLVVAGSENKWAHRRKIAIRELLGEPWILPPSGTVPGGLVSDAFRAAGLNVPRATVSSLSLPVHVHLLNTGRFLALLPESTIRFSAKQFPFKVLSVALPVQPRPVVIVTMKSRTLSPPAKRFIECARAVIRQLLKGI